MATFPYNLNIPDADNNPSEDQPDMQENTNSINQLINVDHFSFSQMDDDGEHRQVTLPIRGGGSGTIPTGRIAAEGTLYTKTGSGETQLFYTPDASTNEYQLTRCITGNFATFAINGNGWTFLPGGMLLKYGLVPAVGDTFSNFPAPGPAFTNIPTCIILTVTSTSTSTNAGAIWKNASTTGFDIRLTDATGPRDVSYVIIGI